MIGVVVEQQQLLWGMGRIGAVVKWWDWFWGAVWIIGSALVAYLTARWFAINAAPADLGVLRYDAPPSSVSSPALPSR